MRKLFLVLILGLTAGLIYEIADNLLNRFTVGTYEIEQINAELPGTAKLMLYVDGTVNLSDDNTFSTSIKLSGNHIASEAWNKANIIKGMVIAFGLSCK